MEPDEIEKAAEMLASILLMQIREEANINRVSSEESEPPKLTN